VEMPMVGTMMLVWDFLCFNLTYFQTSKHRQGSLSLSLSHTHTQGPFFKIWQNYVLC
jgi:hypothetical protein